MFSIAAINEGDNSKTHWEPLAPTKEAQEFRLTQMYQDGLLQQQAGEYVKAQNLFQAIIHDPLWSELETTNFNIPMVRLRYLTFKNLGEAYFKQGSKHYNDALECYLQAVAIDGKDVVLWNRLGTLAFSLGSLNIARRAFENSLRCSINHWGCMEKLMEVLIAIGDDVACLAVAKQLLKVAPSHPRAELVRRVLEAESFPASPKLNLPSPYGLDKLKPQLCSSSSLEKRKADYFLEREISSKERTCQKLEIHVAEASWAALIHSLITALKDQEASSPHPEGNSLYSTKNKCDATLRTWIRNACVCLSVGEKNNQGDGREPLQIGNMETIKSFDTANHMHAEKEQIGLASASLPVCYSPQSSNVKVAECLEDALADKKQKLNTTEGSSVGNEGGSERNHTLKEKDVLTDDEPPYLERRSTRLERLRTRKVERTEDTEAIESELAKTRVSCKMLRESLEPFIVCYEEIEKLPTFLSDIREFEKIQSRSNEEKEVMHFLKNHVDNSGVYHIAHDLLERVSFGTSNSIGSWIGIAELEKLTRSCVQQRSAFCTLFLAEIYMDLAACAAEKQERTIFLQDCEYSLCRVLELVASKLPSHVIAWDEERVTFGFPESKRPNLKDLNGPTNYLGKSSDGAEPHHCWSFWLRYYWLSGRVRSALGNHEKAKEDFKRCLGILEAKEQVDKGSISLPHCRADNEINAERVHHKLHVLQVEDLLQHSAVKMLEQSQYADLIKLLVPILLPKESKGQKHLSIINRKHVDISAELNGLKMLITACENSTPKEYIVALRCYERRLEIFCAAGGFLDSKIGIPQSSMQSCFSLESDQMRNCSGGWFGIVAHEIKLISRCVTHFREMNHESLVSVVPDGTSLGHLQQLILTVMCTITTMIAAKKFSVLTNSDLTNQFEGACFVDAATTFCRLQHLYPASSTEQQVGLLVTMHDILAAHGLCCAGKASEGGEGAFLKMAIKHLLSLETKMKIGTIPDASENNIAEQRSLTEMSLDQEEKEERDQNIKIDFCIDDAKDIEMVSCFQGLSKALDDMPSVENKAVGPEKVPIQRRRKVQVALVPDRQAIAKKKEHLTLDSALDQSFFCLYGLNLWSGLESTSEDGLAVHSNTNLGDYQTKDQCADVFHYLLPYAKVSSRASLLKLRKVLRAIWKQFPEPPASILRNNDVDKFLDNLEFDEDQFREMVLSGHNVREIFKFITWSDLESLENNSGNVIKPPYTLPHINGIRSDSEALDNSNPDSSAPYHEVYSNLYYLLTQVEEISAGDKWPGFVFTKEGEVFVEQNVNLFKYDLLYNPLRFESWQKLANLYDEEVDLMLNDGSKTCNPALWQKNTVWPGRVDCGRRRSRRCLLISLALAKTPEQQSQAHELLALVYYDSLQNVVPSYDQRLHVPNRDSSWKRNCQNSWQHFQKAFAYKPEWSHLFYLGKLAEKRGEECKVALHYYKKAADLNPLAVDPIYRIHASRLKLLCSGGRKNLNVVQVVARFCYLPANEEKVSKLFGDTQLSIHRNGTDLDFTEKLAEQSSNDAKYNQKSMSKSGGSCVEEAWQCLFEDCMKALEACLEGELKHFHKARFRLAQGLLMRNENNDIERAKDELAFCFKSNRSLFTINMWEIDGSTKRNRRKASGAPGYRRGLELSMPESSRKFITCLRKYVLLYFHLCEKTIDVCTLERAYSSLRVDKKFSLCLADLINVAHGKYIYTLAVAISHSRIPDGSSRSNVKSLLERIFSSFMEHGSSWSEVLAGSLAEAYLSSAPEVSESALYGYIHQYIYSLEADNRLDALESVNEKMRKRFKNFKSVNVHCELVYKHAAVSWCRALCFALSAITLMESRDEASYSSNADQNSQLFVELSSDELLTNQYEAYCPYLIVESSKHSNQLRSMRGVWIRQASKENMEKALVLLKQTYTFYRDCSGPFPSGINLFMRSGMYIHRSTEWEANTLTFSGPLVSMDLSVPRKLLLWAYTLVHGQTCSISEAVKFCEDQAKSKMKRGTCMVGSLSSGSNSQGKLGPSSGSNQLMKESSVADTDILVLHPENTANEMVQSGCHVHSCNSPSMSSKQILGEQDQMDEGCAIDDTKN